MGVVEFCFAIAFAGFVGLWLIMAHFLRGRKVGPDRNFVSQAEINSTYHPDDDVKDGTKEVEAEIVVPKPAGTQDHGRVTPLIACIAFACIVFAVAGSWLS